MVLAVPLAVGVALATTVFMPNRARGIDRRGGQPARRRAVGGLRAVGRAGARPRGPPALEWISEHSGGLGAFAGPVTSGSYLLAGLVLGVMVLPIVAAIAREILATVPREQQEAAYALGATKLGDGARGDAAVGALGDRGCVRAGPGAGRGRDDRHRPAARQHAEHGRLAARPGRDAGER